MSASTPIPLADLWAKSEPPHRLDVHLLDTAAAALWLWDNQLSPATRDWVSRIAPDGEGARFFAWLAALHDVGKATPAFQSKQPHLGAGAQVPSGVDSGWPHTWAGAVLVRGAARAAGWGRKSVGWVLPLISGHHGTVPQRGVYNDSRSVSLPQGAGLSHWESVQQDLIDLVSRQVGYAEWPAEPRSVPSRAQQLELAGLIIQSDWVASHGTVPPVWGSQRVSLEESQVRIRRVAEDLRITGGWGARQVPTLGEVASRFDWALRPLQVVAARAAREMSAPGLLIVEAPTGEGKTEAALAAAEILSARTGRDGVHVALPTQATTDAMWGRVSTWASRVASEVPQLLAHGKASSNVAWKAARREGRGVSHWYLEHDKSLLAPVVVSTIDVLLHAATRTRHVALRASGAFRKVLVVDEVHASDTRMHALVCELLRWAGNAGTPVVLLSATLPPRMRDELACSYAGGATNQVPSRISLDVPHCEGYPRITGVSGVAGGEVQAEVWGAPARPGGQRSVRVELLDSSLIDDLRGRLREGGVAMVVRNTVARAQSTAEQLREEFGDDVVLLHSRLTARDRAERTRLLLEELGPFGRRPRRRILVGTQVLEQSLDIDADVLITDHAPIDLLIQRAGRMHRHDTTRRPQLLSSPTIVVDGVTFSGEAAPTFPSGAEFIYGRAPLLAAAATVAERPTWNLPGDTPGLISRATVSPEIPESWLPDWEDALEEHRAKVAEEAAAAGCVLLGRAGHLTAETLDGLHHAKSSPEDHSTLIRGVDGGEEVGVLTKVGTSTLRLPANVSVEDPDVTLDLRHGPVEVGGVRVSYHPWLGLQVLR